LCSKKQMEILFAKGSSSSVYPVRLVYTETPVDLIFPAQAMFVVPKRNHKKAHDRNKLKRRMREVYRLNKSTLYEKLRLKNKKLLMAFIYTGRTQEGYAVIETSLLKLLNKIQEFNEA
jgi:ribonuclease P protein component